MDTRLVIFFVTALFVVAAAAIGLGVGSGEIFFASLLTLGLCVLVLIVRPQIATFVVVASYASGLTCPGLPGQLGIYYTACMAVGLGMVVLVIFGQAPFPRFSPVLLVSLTFCGVVLATGLVRGMGFQFLGSGQWGGFAYIAILFNATLVVTLPSVNLSATWWPRAILLMGLLAPLKLVADLLIVNGLPYGLVSMFLQTGDTVGTLLAEQNAVGDVLSRYTSAGVAAQSLVIAFLARVHTSRLFQARSLTSILGLALIVILSFFSGYRLMTMMVVFVVFIAALLQRSLTAPRVVVGCAMAAIAVAILYSVSAQLPMNIQRAISWLPGISISGSAAANASGTIEWRLELWQEALRYIPDYIWIGKGFSYDGELYVKLLNNYGTTDTIQWALVTGAYHNGYLSLLLVTGLLGLVLGLSLLIGVSVRQIRANRRAWNNPVLLRCHQAFHASQLCWVIVFLTVYGDVTAVFPGFFFTWAVMEALVQCDRRSTLQIAATEGDLRPTEEDSHYASPSVAPF